MPVLTLDTIELHHKRVLLREDLNVPIEDHHVTSTARIDAAIPTLKKLIEAKACVMILSHLGRPEEGVFDAAFSLQPVADVLTKKLGQPVRLVRDWLNGVEVKPGEVVLCENVRFNKGENADDETLSKQMAKCCDVFVMDAFATAHRAQASTHGVAKYAPVAVAGPLLQAELSALEKSFSAAKHPVVAVIGGSKVSTKLKLLKNLSLKVDCLIVGGGIANTFIASAGFRVGKSLYEPTLVAETQLFLEDLKKRNIALPIPTDVVVAQSFDKNAKGIVKKVFDVEADDMILDIGPETVLLYQKHLKSAQTIIWNGPVGVFEFPAFAAGTKAIAKAIADSAAFSIAGGGDTLSAIEQFGVQDQISYVSTGGGAFLEFCEGQKLPAVAILEERMKTL
jgi:phosphoglycerate kinase